MLWPDFVLELPSLLGGRRVHLETAGAHPGALERVLPAIDHISLDLKLPADLDPPEDLALASVEAVPTDADSWTRARRACLTLCAGRDAAAKIVVAGGRRSTDFMPLFEDLARLAPDIPLYLQPATPVGEVRAPSIDLLCDLAEDGIDLGLVVRVVPQVHRILRIR